MIQANELRIGSIVWCGHNCTITHIDGYNPINNSVKVDSYNLWVPFNSIEHVPINTKWLLMLGFKKSELLNGIFSIDRFTILEFNNKYKIDLSSSSISIKSVHQLQNLYFALTGFELVLSTVPASI